MHNLRCNLCHMDQLISLWLIYCHNCFQVSLFIILLHIFFIVNAARKRGMRCYQRQQFSANLFMSYEWVVSGLCVTSNGSGLLKKYIIKATAFCGSHLSNGLGFVQSIFQCRTIHNLFVQKFDEILPGLVDIYQKLHVLIRTKIIGP